MADLRSFGWVTNDLEPKMSVRKSLYVRFSLAERVGYGETAHTQYYDVWAWGQTAQSLIDLNVRKGSLVWVRGSLELVDYTKRDGVTKDKRLKLKLLEWRYTQGGDTKAPHTNEKGVSQTAEHHGPIAVVDGERETLPE